MNTVGGDIGGVDERLRRKKHGVRRGVVVVVELGGGNDGEDDEVEKEVEVRRSEAREEKRGQCRSSFSEDEIGNHWDCELQPHSHG